MKDNMYYGLFLDMGLGKTVSSLTAIVDLLDEGEIDRVLIIGPKRVAESVWIQEAAKWQHTAHLTFSGIFGTVKQRLKAAETDADIHVISKDNIAWLCGVHGGTFLPYDMIVIDESSAFKSSDSVKFKALSKAIPSIPRRYILTGTPTPKGLIDLWSQIFLLDLGARLGATFGKYKARYFQVASRDRSGEHIYSYKPQSSEASEVIKELIGDVVVSMKSEDYLDLPPLIENNVMVRFDDKLRDKYDKFVIEKVLEIFGEDASAPVTAANAQALSNKLLQFANGAVYDADMIAHKVHDLKLQALEEVIESANGAPVLVSVCFRSDFVRIKEHFKKLKVVKMEGQQDIDDWNAGNLDIMMMHPASGGHGLNLQFGSNHMAMFGLNWSLELNQQFVKRVHRNGNRHKRIFLHRILAEGTHDMKVVANLGGKDLVQSDLLDAVKDTINQVKKSMKIK